MSPPGIPTRPLRQYGWLAVALCLFAATVLFRFMALVGFPNDQYEHLAGAQQMLAGEWPTRDFFDPGMPLTYAMSAVAQLLLGRTLFAEAVLTTSALGLAAACTFAGARLLSRSWLIALVVTVLSVAIFPRPYAYPKLLVTAVAPLVIWAWVRSPTWPRLAALALTVVVAFLFRHDYGAYVGVGALVALFLAPWTTLRQIAVRIGVFGGLIALFLVPYAISIGGPGAFVQSLVSFIEYGRRHSARTPVAMQALDWGPEAQLFWGFHALPIVACVILAIDRWRGRASDLLLVAPLAAMAVIANILLIRDPLSARLPDAVVPAALLAAWVAGRAWQVEGGLRRSTATALAVIGLALASRAVASVGSTTEQIDRTGLAVLGIGGIPGVVGARTSDLLERYSPRQAPDGHFPAMVPFFEYLDRCTASDDRLFIAGYAPEIYVYSHRLFAGGQKVFLEGSFASEEDQAEIVERMTGQRVLFAVLLTDVLAEWRDGFPRIDAYVEGRFVPMTEIPITDDRALRVMLDPGIPPRGTDPATGWPCYR